ncbi:MAG: hypothetical protein V4671_22620 [Armatimonadota bacterium]
MTTLAQISIDLIGNTSKFDAAMNRAVSSGSSQGARAGASFGSSFASGFSSPILNAISGVNSLIGGLQTTVGMALDISGMRTNATFNFYRRQLTGIAGDAGIAGKAFKGLTDIAANSNFDTDQVVQLGLRYAGKTGDVAGAVGKTQNVIDSAAALGVDSLLFERFRKNLEDMAVKGNTKIDKPDREQLTGYAPQIGLQIGRTLGISTAEANKRLLTMSGKEVVSLIERIGAANAGLAASQASSDPIRIGKNIIDSLKQGMEPTGGLLNSVFTPITAGVKTMVDNLGGLNETTHGIAGLVGLIGGGIGVVRYFGGATMTAIGATRSLTGSLLQMAGAAETAALATRTGAVSTAIGSAAGSAVAGGAAGGIGALGKGGAGAVSGIAKTFTILGTVVKFAKLAGGIIAGLLPLGAQMGAGWMAQRARASGHPGKANMWDGVSMGIGTGSTWGMIAGGALGALIGIPGGLPGMIAGAGIGATAGGLVGGAIGGIGGGIQGGEKLRGEPKTEMAQLKDAIKENTAATKTSSKSLGGGVMTSASVSLIEREWAVYQLARGGMTGVG